MLLLNWVNKTQDGSSTKRGCLHTATEIKKCEQSPQLCSSCQSSPTGPCNSNEFPERRRKCIHCVESDSTNCTVSNDSKYCNSPEDDCAVIEIAGKIKQACFSDLSENEKNTCAEANGKCVKCQSNDCNKIPLTTCFACSGDQCQRTSHQNDTKVCSENGCVALFRGCRSTVILN